MLKKIKSWKKLTKGEQNGFYYVYKGYSKMTSSYDIHKEYQKECEKRSIKEQKLEEKNNVSYHNY